ncbi:hypothetical protein [Nocardia sp. NPDC127526]|uniref:hypothetical protein n=1 Tax=Nocardia sp. NPDC127526 TaxID=3345393 RepID=UPI00363794E5
MTATPLAELVEAVKKIQAGDADAALAMACAISEGSVTLQDIVTAARAAQGH